LGGQICEGVIGFTNYLGERYCCFDGEGRRINWGKRELWS